MSAQAHVITMECELREIIARGGEGSVISCGAVCEPHGVYMTARQLGDLRITWADAEQRLDGLSTRLERLGGTS